VEGFLGTQLHVNGVVTLNEPGVCTSLWRHTLHFEWRQLRRRGALLRGRWCCSPLCITLVLPLPLGHGHGCCFG
jgi:hypothetical protein